MSESAGNAVVLPNSRRPSIRAMFTERRTYLRPLDEDGKVFETPAQQMDRIIGHQQYLWENQLGRELNDAEWDELAELRSLMEQKKVSVSGRVKWMGGTDVVKARASGAFNCSYTPVAIPADLVDVFWLLLQGCGVGFKPKPGLLKGLPSSITEVEYIGSTREDKGGAEDSTQTIDLANGVWHIKVGDSAQAWAKALGMLTAEKPRVKKLIIDLSELRPGGKRLKGYGWLSSGWEPLMRGFKGIVGVLQNKADALLDAIDIGDIVNFLGTVLSSRRSAQIWLKEVDVNDYLSFDDETMRFIDAKVDRYEKGLAHREQSNNSIAFKVKPTRDTIVWLLKRILTGGEPGFVNMIEMLRRAPDADGLNPCAEILLPPKGFCNLMQVVWHRFNGDFAGLLRAQYLAGRANYRQTCVSMRDGVLQLQWNDNQKLLRLCGVSPTGYVAWEFLNNPQRLQLVAQAARDGANSMADDFGTPRARSVTQCQPNGTGSKAMGLEGDEIQEGAHLSPSQYIFNNVNFSIYDEILPVLREANYKMTPNPVDPTGILVTFPVAYPDSPLYKNVLKEVDGVDGLEELSISAETAVDQLERYRILMQNYIDHNCSITISYDEHEIDDMADWFMENWDNYVGVSFLKRNDPTRTAKELGFSYLPQQAVSKRMYEEYIATLKPVDLSRDSSYDMLDVGGCGVGSGVACPVR